MKTERQNEILRIIREREVATQEEIAGALRSRGYRVTQATVSRDLRELQLNKVAMGGGGYRYALPEKSEDAVSQRLTRILRDSLVSVAHAGQMIVVRTLSGSANVAGEAIDTLSWPEILGTIAGDNTIFIVVRSEAEAAEITDRIRKMNE